MKACVLLMWIVVLTLTGCTPERKGLEVEKILDSKTVWSGDHTNKPEIKRKKDNLQIVCLGNVKYIYLDRSFMGGLSPLYENGALVSCSQDVLPDNGRYMFYKVCHEGHLYYQLAVMKGAALSISLNANGKPKECTPE